MSRPLVNQQLIEHLQECFPNTVPCHRDVNLVDIHRMQGEQRVIEKLINMINDQSIHDEFEADLMSQFS